MNVGEKIKEIRKFKKLSQKQLGERLGVSQAMIAQYENGDRNPKRETLQKIADALEVDISAVMDINLLPNQETHFTFGTEIKNKIPGEIIIDITKDNFEKYKKIFLLAFNKIIDELYSNFYSETHFYNAQTGEEVFFSEEELNPKNMDDEHIFMYFQKAVKEIRYNNILDIFSIIFL